MKPVGVARQQQGAVLVVGIIFLALLSLIGVTAYSVATQEERMAGNARDRMRAFEAAEVALRDCERRLSGVAAPLFSADGSTESGMYEMPATGAAEKWQTINWTSDSTRLLVGVAGVAEQPRCIVQRLARVKSNNPSQRSELPQPVAYAYQVTGRGVGANRFTAVVLQSTFVRD
jgi:type IV pilus assembly protein PilX